MSNDPPDYLSSKESGSRQDSSSIPTNPLLQPLDGSHVQKLLLNFQDTTSYLSNNNSKSFVGKVYGMCTMKEYNQKVQMNTANDLERDSSKTVNFKLTLKSFQRSDAFRTFKPEDVRPSMWCRRTVYYSLCYFVDADVVKKSYLMDKNFTFLDIYNFLRDRLRSIWQDLTVQRCTRHRGYIECFEISIRFLIYANEVLCENEEYEVAQNTLLLNTCLDKLMDGYSDVRSTVNKVTPSESINQMIQNDPNFKLVMNVLTFVSPREAEFWSYRLLLLIPQLLTPGCSATFCDICQRMPSHIKKRRLVKFSVSACLAATSGNIFLYFKLMNSPKCHPLQAALMNRFSGCIRVRFLYNILTNKIVKETVNPLSFEKMKQLLGYEQEPDHKLQSFLERYGVKAQAGDATVKLETINMEKLTKDNMNLAKMAGQTQMGMKAVMEKFKAFQNIQLLLDPDFRAPFIPAKAYLNIPDFEKKMEQEKQKETKVTKKESKKDGDSKKRQKESEESKGEVAKPEPTTVIPKVTVASDLHKEQTLVKGNISLKYTKLQNHRDKRGALVSKAQIQIPKLKQISELDFNEEAILNNNNFKEVSKIIIKRVMSKRKESEKVKEGQEEEDECEIELEEEGREFENFSYDKVSMELERIKKEKNYIYMSLNGSEMYLESELKKYLDKTMSKCMLYSLYICKRCHNSKKKYEKIFKKIIKKIIGSKTSVMKLIRELKEVSRNGSVRREGVKGLRLLRLIRELRWADISSLLSSKNMRLERVTNFIRNQIEGMIKRNEKVKNIETRTSIFNAGVNLTYSKLESIVSNTYKQLTRLPQNRRNVCNPEVWGTGIFVHLTFFDFKTSQMKTFPSQRLGNGLLQFKEYVRDYMNSDYCLNLKLDIMKICGLKMVKEDLIPTSEEHLRTMFQLMRCEFPYKNEAMDNWCRIPFSINLSVNLKSDHSLTKVRFEDEFYIKDEQDEVRETGKGKNESRTLNSKVEYSSELYRSLISARDVRYRNQQQVAVFASSRTFELGEEDFLYNLYSSKRSSRYLRFRERLPVVDTLSLLSFILNNRMGPEEGELGVWCIVCYRLSVSKMDILTLFNMSKRLETCKCKNKSKRIVNRLNLVLEAVNRSLTNSIIEQARAYNIQEPEKIIKNKVIFTCVGFEYESSETEKNDLEGFEVPEREDNVVITRLLNPEGMKRAVEKVWESLVREGRIKVLQRPVNIPDLRTFLIDLAISDNVKLEELRRNPQGIIANSIQRFINRVIIEFPETLWEVYSNKQKVFEELEEMNYRGFREYEVSPEYSKNGFIAMLMNLKEYIKDSEEKINENGLVNHRKNVRGRQLKEMGTLDSELERRILVDSLTKFVFRTLECFRVQKFLVPHPVAFYMENILSPN